MFTVQGKRAWMGIVNTAMMSCSGKDACGPDLEWIDGDTYYKNQVPGLDPIFGSDGREHATWNGNSNAVSNIDDASDGGNYFALCEFTCPS